MINFVLKEIQDELIEKVHKRFTGNIKIQINMFEGGIPNINIGEALIAVNPLSGLFV